jgi:hypothetical protein
VLIESAISVLASTPSVMRAMLAPLPDELVVTQGPDGWCARDVAAHLAARQRPAIIGRVEAILALPGGAIPTIPHNLMDPAPYRARPLDDVFAEFDEGRAEAVALLRRLTLEELALRGVMGEIGEVSVADVIHHVAFHDLVHVSQAAQLALGPLEPLRGAMRVFR